MARELILKLGKKITDRVDVKLGMTKLDETSPEYYGLASVVTDEMAELALAMKVRVPTTPAEIGKKVGKDPVYVEQLFDQMSMIGLLEYNWENADHHKQWTLPIFVPGSAELMNMNLQQVEEHPEITAAYAIADVVAIGAMRAAQDAGRTVGKDLSIIGFDGLALGEYLTPRLATIGQSVERLAREATGTLLDAIENGAPARRVTVPFTVISGESVGLGPGAQAKM